MRAPPAGSCTLALAVGLGLAAGCATRDSYLVAPQALGRAAALDEAARAAAAVPATREPDRRRAYLRASALPPGALGAAAAAPPELPVRVEVRARNPMVTAGAVLVYIGSVLSVAGSIWFLATLPQGGDLHLAGGLVALGAEPPMWIGTILWPLGIMRPPYEARPGRRDVQYLDDGPAAPGTKDGAPAAQVGGLRLRF